MTYYYKVVENGELVNLQKTDFPCIVDDILQEITEEEYVEISNRIAAEAEAEYVQEEKTKDDRIAELEQENAALLFQVLTGEDYESV